MAIVYVEGFEAIETSGALVVILGTLPGGDSLRPREYYAKSTNTFWDIMGDLFGASRALPYAERVAVLNQRRIAVWDVLRSADRAGSTDSGIVKGSEIANDFARFFRNHSAIRRIYFNGQPAEEYFQRLVAPILVVTREIPHRILASTSPANTHMTKQAKIAEWRAIEGDLAP